MMTNRSFRKGVTAAGNSQLTATLLLSSINQIDTASVSGLGVALQNINAVGDEIDIYNTTGQAVLIWPPVGGQINSAGVNASGITIAALAGGIPGHVRVTCTGNNTFAGSELSSTVSGPVCIGGAQISGSLQSVHGTIYQQNTNTQPTADFYHNTLVNTVTYTGTGTSGDTIGLNSAMIVLANGNTISGSASQHTAGLYGVSYLGPDGNAAGVVTWVNGVVATSGNQGTGTVTNAVDFRGHIDINTAGGTLTNHYFLYQENSTAATHEYGAYFSAPVGIGGQTPTYNLDMSAGLTGNLSGNWMRIGTGNGTLLVTSGGASIFPGANPGAGGFGANEIWVGSGAAIATTSTSGFLYLPTCAGAPTGVSGAAGKAAVIFDTTNNKIWFSVGGGTWKGVVVA